MQVLTKSGEASNVKAALQEVTESLNDELSNLPGKISKMKADITAGISGGSVKITVAIDTSSLATKRLIWANEPGSNETSALKRTEEKVNDRLSELDGEIVGFYQKIISPPVPKRTYATLIVAINEGLKEETKDLTFEERRERLASIIRLLGNDPKAINISHLAKVFGVSRDTIYRDLENIGAER